MQKTITDRFHNKSGLTLYALACGYQQTTTVTEGRVELYLEMGAFHVRFIPLNGSVHDTMGEWDSFDTLTEARTHYRKLIARKA